MALCRGSPRNARWGRRRSSKKPATQSVTRCARRTGSVVSGCSQGPPAPGAECASSWARMSGLWRAWSVAQHSKSRCASLSTTSSPRSCRQLRHQGLLPQWSSRPGSNCGARAARRRSWSWGHQGHACACGIPDRNRPGAIQRWRPRPYPLELKFLQNCLAAASLGMQCAGLSPERRDRTVMGFVDRNDVAAWLYAHVWHSRGWP